LQHERQRRREGRPGRHRGAFTLLRRAHRAARRGKEGAPDDVRDVCAEAKANGFDAKTFRKVVPIRVQDRDKRREEEEILDLYLAALGMS